MSLSVFRVDPFQEMKHIHRQMDSLFNGFLSTPTTQDNNNNTLSAQSSRSWIPSVDVRETQDSIVMHAELPGMKKEGILKAFRNKCKSLHTRIRNHSNTRHTITYPTSVATTTTTATTTATLPSPLAPHSVTFDHHIDISIDFEDGCLTLSGEKKHEKREENDKFHRVERSYGRFKRSFVLPEGVDSSQINATFENGVLELTVTKPPQKENKRQRIDINSKL